MAAQKDEVALINSLKLLSQFVVYGDKHSESFFEFFCEKSTLAVFNDICSSFVGDAVKEQVIQTINVLVKNVRTTTSFYYLLSNNYLNILMLKSNCLNFDNEEILAQYITLLKTISLKLNVQTIQVQRNLEKLAFEFTLTIYCDIPDELAFCLTVFLQPRFPDRPRKISSL